MKKKKGKKNKNKNKPYRAQAPLEGCLFCIKKQMCHCAHYAHLRTLHTFSIVPIFANEIKDESRFAANKGRGC